MIMASFSRLVAILAATSVASVSCNPVPDSSDDIIVISRGFVGHDSKAESLLGAEVLANCNQAHNCEIYDDPIFGKAIRFVQGMEPGSAGYNATVLASQSKHGQSGNTTIIEARDGKDQTKIMAGKNVLNYGNVQPQVVLNNMYNPCQEWGCDFGTQWYWTTAVNGWGPPGETGTKPQSYAVTFNIAANYFGWESRNNYIEIIKRMSEKGQDWKNQHWEYATWIYNDNGGYWDWSHSGDQWEVRQSDYFSVSRWTTSPSTAMKGYMNVHLSSSWGGKSNWGCDRVYNIVKDAISALNGWGGAFFGAIAGDTCPDKD